MRDNPLLVRIWSLVVFQSFIFPLPCLIILLFQKDRDKVLFFSHNFQHQALTHSMVSSLDSRVWSNFWRMEKMKEKIEGTLPKSCFPQRSTTCLDAPNSILGHIDCWAVTESPILQRTCFRGHILCRVTTPLVWTELLWTSITVSDHYLEWSRRWQQSSNLAQILQNSHLPVPP